ncbi:J domain-containing protein 1 [Pleurostoma richardsiae]|uniref:J domain-containing protein 1 n=1 Tax=Pleurostoma richardsiae TaxID=41990 RepID=A0AA38RG16_9PEZI|nr:J domain-containing protein 1 [Pleurostoma richardsiae]
MLLKKSTIVLCTSCNASSTFGLPASITSSSTSPSAPPRQRSKRAPGLSSPGRFYATIPHGDSFDGHYDHDELHHHWPSKKEPTPYEIFGQKRGAPYSKARFYQLVKIYHPDRYHHLHHHGLPHATKLHRYHLIVAANDILCHPEKRRAYDLYGAGWGGQPDMLNNSREADRSWRERPGSPAQNATWEDWEKWYRQRDGEKQEPLYMSNGGFVAVVVFFILVGSWGQATRAGTNSLSLLEMRQQKHAAVSKEMHRRQAESAQLSREGRIESFLRQREGWGYGDATAGHMPDEHGQSPPLRR